MNQLTGSHDSGILVRPVSPSCATVCTLVPPENVNCDVIQMLVVIFITGIFSFILRL